MTCYIHAKESLTASFGARDLDFTARSLVMFRDIFIIRLVPTAFASERPLEATIILVVLYVRSPNELWAVETMHSVELAPC